MAGDYGSQHRTDAYDEKLHWAVEENLYNYEEELKVLNKNYEQNGDPKKVAAKNAEDVVLKYQRKSKKSRAQRRSKSND